MAGVRGDARGDRAQYRLGARRAAALTSRRTATPRPAGGGAVTPGGRRMVLALGIVGGVSIAGALALSAFRQNVTFFFDPTQVAAGRVPARERFRLGGMVTQGSLKRASGSLEVRFVVTDFDHDVPVSYTGVLPDLFREGAGEVAHGRLPADGNFIPD